MENLPAEFAGLDADLYSDPAATAVPGSDKVPAIPGGEGGVDLPAGSSGSDVRITETDSPATSGFKHASLVDLTPKVVQPTVNDLVMQQLLAKVEEKKTSPQLPKQQLGDKSVGALIAALTALNCPHARLQSIIGVQILQKTDGTQFLQFLTR